MFAFADSTLAKREIPTTLDEVVCTTATTLRILDSARTGREMPVEWLLEHDAD
jgi:hypothetical protein